jgi:hypothetical protein
MMSELLNYLMAQKFIAEIPYVNGNKSDDSLLKINNALKELAEIHKEKDALTAENKRLTDIIRELVEDGDRLKLDHWVEVEADGKEYCNMCGCLFGNDHEFDCPITLHAALMERVKGMVI